MVLEEKRFSNHEKELTEFSQEEVNNSEATKQSGN